MQNFRCVVHLIISNNEGIRKIPHMSQEIGHYATKPLEILLENFI
jgi:hypothetical protein